MTVQHTPWLRTLRRIAFGQRKELAEIVAELRCEDERMSVLRRRYAERERELAEVEDAIRKYEWGEMRDY